MTNHVHLLVQAGNMPLSSFIGALASTYARSINARSGRAGHLFERRYRASLVQEDSYLLEVVRYIHLNPVRAHIVTSPGDYLWSSHQAGVYFHPKDPDTLLQGDDVLPKLQLPPQRIMF